MIAIKNTVPHKIDFHRDYLETSFSIESTHQDMATSFGNINTMYSESSVLEDIVLNKYLYLYSAAKLISGRDSRSSFVTESFLSQNYFDSKFPIDKPLNIDIQNGDLTLPVVSTNSIPIDSIIIESDSNGSPGDSQNNNSNNDLSVITTGNSSSLFVYDKMVNSLSMSDLYLTLTLKLKDVSHINGIYLRLYSDTGASYPNIEILEGSIDGVHWKSIASSYKIEELKNINKADYYVRCQTIEAKIIRVRFSQSGYSPISTGFGTRYKYAIGIREISVKQTIYDSTGEYISTPFSNKSAVSYARVTKEDTGDVKYLISANNGTKWTEMPPGEKVYLYNETLGLRDGVDINSVRLKVLMDKGKVAINKDLVKEYALINDSEKYFLKDTPINLVARVGNHISYGNLKQYPIQMKDLTALPTSIIEDDANIDYTAILYYIPYYSTMHEDIVLRLNGAKVKNDRTIYEFKKHQDKNHSIIAFKNKAISTNSGELTVEFKRVGTQPGTQTISLPQLPFSSIPSSMQVEETVDEDTRTLEDYEYEYLDGKIEISDVSFNPDAVYMVSYLPSVDISSSIKSSDTNEILVQNIKQVQDLKLFFEYSIKSDSNSESLKYFTPICNQYVLELR